VSAQRTITLLDGGTGRELLRMGAPFRQPEWSALALMEAPEFVTRVHRSYVAAGADVITTNSYALVPFHIGAERFARRGAALAALAGELARAVADGAGRAVRVAGSLPPVCGSYRPDLFAPAEARPVLEQLVQALEPSVDLWLSETMGSLAEVSLVAEVLGRSARPWWVSYTLADADQRAPGALLRSGEPAAAAATHALRLGARAVLFNCCQPEVIGAALTQSRQALRGAPVPLGAYANAFGPKNASAAANAELSRLRADLSPPEYLQWARAWLEAGAEIVGGCCGVGPEHIALLRAALAPELGAAATGNGRLK